MFKKNLFLTRGINECLPKSIQYLLWSLLFENKDNENLDYLQIFELSYDRNVNQLKVIWRQEDPEFEKILYFTDVESLDNDMKVWVICTAPGTEEEYSTMLLPEEY